MSFNSFYKQLEQKAREAFPNLAAETQVSWDYLVSPLEIELPQSVQSFVSEAIKVAYKASRQEKYTQNIQGAPKEILDCKVKNHSVLMAYDFHTTENGEAYLVEVNTNASGYIFASLMEATHRDSALLDSPEIKNLKESFFKELSLWGQPITGRRVAIVDEDIPAQKMFPEFLMYRDLFNSWGWHSRIVESKSLQPKDFDLVYNRITDFYLEFPQHAQLREAFLKQSLCLTPQPREYALLADKQRLVELSTAGWLEKLNLSEQEIADLRKVLIPTFERAQFGTEEEIWSQRKTLFFKPKRSFGAKSVYRGESVSRKVFERLMQEDILIQKFVPAQKVPTDDPRSVLNNWKFDLRCFAYEDQLHLCVARIYQGQVTNFASPLGGFTKVKFK